MGQQPALGVDDEAARPFVPDLDPETLLELGQQLRPDPVQCLHGIGPRQDEEEDELVAPDPALGHHVFVPQDRPAERFQGLGHLAQDPVVGLPAVYLLERLLAREVEKEHPDLPPPFHVPPDVLQHGRDRGQAGVRIVEIAPDLQPLRAELQVLLAESVRFHQGSASSSAVSRTWRLSATSRTEKGFVM